MGPEPEIFVPPSDEGARGNNGRGPGTTLNPVHTQFSDLGRLSLVSAHVQPHCILDHLLVSEQVISRFSCRHRCEQVLVDIDGLKNSKFRNWAPSLGNGNR